jgi:hypothetical protein
MLWKIMEKLFGNRAKEGKKGEEYITAPAEQEPVKAVVKPYLTAKQVAENNILECVSYGCLIKKVDWDGLFQVTPELYPPKEQFEIKKKSNGTNQFYLFGGRYLLFHPANDGNPTCPFEWYMEDKDGRVKQVMSNQFAFKNIINLEEVLYKMISLYERSIDQDIVLDSMAFALKLEDDVYPGYQGRAKLVLTDDAVCTNNIKAGKMKDAKIYFINQFLDHFLGWNFGVVIGANPRLQGKLKEFNQLVIQKGMREDAGPGFRVWCSEDVVHYDLNKT